MLKILLDILTLGLSAILRKLRKSLIQEIESDITKTLTDQQERLFYLKFELRIKEKLIDKYVLAEYPFILLMAENAKKYVRKHMPEIAEKKIKEFDEFVENVGKYKDLMLEKLLEQNKREKKLQQPQKFEGVY